MKAIRTSVIIIAMFQLFGLITGVSYLTLIGVWLATWIGSIIWVPIEIAWAESMAETIIKLEEDK